MNLLAVPDTSTQQDSSSFLALLMATVWCRAVDVASRHGPPAFRRDQSHEGFYVRGRLDLRRTAQVRGGAPSTAAAPCTAARRSSG
jgi:5-methylcytosine-specific restriction endonuclease McrBC regulatory subunit McrC